MSRGVDVSQASRPCMRTSVRDSLVLNDSHIVL